MGYTHYWKFTKKPQDITNDGGQSGAELFKIAVSMFKEGLAKIPAQISVSDYTYNTETKKWEETTKLLPFKLCNGQGIGEPIITDTQLVFNGDSFNEDDYETFCIDLVSTSDFCKTAHRPYDVAVCLALLCFKEVFGKDFSFSSDGDIENGEEGWKLAKEIFAVINH